MALSFELRVLLASRSPQRVLRALDQPGITVCAVASHKLQLMRLLIETQPHAVLFDDIACDSSLLAFIENALSVSPPRIVCSTEAGEKADAVFFETTPKALCLALHQAFSAPVSQLAAPSLSERLRHAQTLLHELDMPETLLGRNTVALAAVWLSAMPQPIPSLKHWLYPHLARNQDITAAAAERRIRSAIESTWLRGSLNAQSKLFGFTVSAERGKPTNAEFLFLLAEHIRRLL